MKEIRRCLILLHPVKHSSMFTRIFMILFIYSVTYTANLFGKAFVNVRNCLRKEKHMTQTKNIDEFYTKTTQRGGYSKLCVKKKCYIDLLHFSTRCLYGKHNLVSFYGRIVF